tara:strand:- start:415 stop:756 length:342 start_codon:yes stop_codon:yes gene_type:complete
MAKNLYHKAHPTDVDLCSLWSRVKFKAALCVLVVFLPDPDNRENINILLKELANKKQGYDTTELPNSDWIFIQYDKISWAQSFQTFLATKGFHSKVFVKGELLEPRDLVTESK